MSLVAFLFQNTKLFGTVPAFFHRDFEEVNLRFYVVRQTAQGPRRGVVFVKELVPRPLLAWIARVCYSENYVSVPMSHMIRPGESYLYNWNESRLKIHVTGELLSAAPNSLERFFTEHYWGYTRVSPTRTYEYEVKHPVWNLFEADECRLDADLAGLYGPRFGPIFSRGIASVFVADGSPVTVHWPTTL